MRRVKGSSGPGCTLKWTDRLVGHLARVGFDARYGARPLQRTIEREIVAPLAKWLLQQPSLARGVLEADWTDGGIRFRATGV